MDKKELDNGMKDASKGKKGASAHDDEAVSEAKKKADDVPSAKSEGEEESFEPDLDWVMGAVGPFFNNNRGLGELLFDKLKESGVNTEAAALQSLVKVLKKLNQEYNDLSEALGNNLKKIDTLETQSKDLAQAVKDAIKELGGSSVEEGDVDIGGDMGMPPPDDIGAGGDMGMPPPDDIGAGGDMGMPPPDTGMDMGMPPPDAGMDMGMPPPDTGMGMDMGMPPPAGAGGTISDAREKLLLGRSRQEVKGIISDARMKKTARRIVNRARKSRNSTRLNPSIIDSCTGGF